jgi:alkaline phosphatase D
MIKRLLCLCCFLLSLHSTGHAQAIEDYYDLDLRPFYHGVASGDPLTDGFIIWTRVTPDVDGTATVIYRVATDPGMQNIVTVGAIDTDASRDYTVKVDVRGLEAGQSYWYQFSSLETDSIVGHARTAPETADESLRFAVVSCSNFEWGYFSGYEKIARKRDLDAVIHLGDYLYEYGDNASYSSPVIRDERVLFPSHELLNLDDYRTRYATYRLDPNLRAAHQNHAFITIWDDHESANDAWMMGAENHDPETQGEWTDRLAAAKQAYFEWMPIRENGSSFYRTLQYGPLADIILLDTRIEGREQQINDVTDMALYAPERTLLGSTQKAWLKEQLMTSTAQWKVVANQVIFSEFNVGWAGPATGATPEQTESQFLDIWDGYPAEREELIQFLSDQNINDTIILTGDFHSSFAMEVVSDPDASIPYLTQGIGSVAVEFATPSISAANFDENLTPELSAGLEFQINQPIAELSGYNPNPHMKFVDLDRHGYFVLTISESSAQADYYYLEDILVPQTVEAWGAGLQSMAGTQTLMLAEVEANGQVIGPRLMITEVMSKQDSSGTEDFFEITNVGDRIADLTGWKWDDDSQDIAEAIALTGELQLLPGESLIVTSLNATAFRDWWGLNDSVKVSDNEGPGLGKNDGIALFDANDQLYLFFTYALDGVVLSDGSRSIGEHAGFSAGGSETVSMILDPAFGVDEPRYTNAAVEATSAFASALSENEFGSPGTTGLEFPEVPLGMGPLVLTEVQSKQSDTAHSGAEDYFELTNFGLNAVDISGYSWHDSGRSAGVAATYALPEGTSIAAGESVIFTEADPNAFREWWGVDETVQVFQTIGANGLGKDDGVSFFDKDGNEVFFFSYAAGAFLLDDGSVALGDHAGISAGGANEYQALIWVPSSGLLKPRYMAADGTRAGTFKALIGDDLGSPGVSIPIVVNASTVSVLDSSAEEGSGALNFTVRRSDNSATFSVSYALAEGSSADASDFVEMAGGVLQFEAGGVLEQSISVTLLDDTEIESDEIILISLSDLTVVSGEVVIETAVAAGTIENDDFPVSPVTGNGILTTTHLSTQALSAAEIPAYHAATKRLYCTASDGIEVIDLSDPANPVLLNKIIPSGLGLIADNISSIDISGDTLAAAIIADPKTDAGQLALFDAATGTLVSQLSIGSNPDSVRFTDNGHYVLVAIEGELDGPVSTDIAKGGVDIIDLTNGRANPVVRSARFDAFDAIADELVAAGVRLFEGAIPSYDFEPEYAIANAAGTKAMVTVQEANALALLDIATASFEAIIPLGEKDFSGLMADFSDRDGAEESKLIRPSTGNPVFGLYMPDEIAAFRAAGQDYYITANEGDDRDDFLTPEESIRVGDESYVLDPTAFPNAAQLKEDAQLGRLTVSNSPGLRGDIDDDGDVDRILAYGGRSFSIFDAEGTMIYDSGDLLETIIAADFPESFDDGRSDNKGPEPEGVKTAVLGGRTYAFVGMERSHLVFVFDVSNPFAPEYVTAFGNLGDTNPEGMRIISADESPTQDDLLIVANEDSGTVSVYSLDFETIEELPWTGFEESSDPIAGSVDWFGQFLVYPGNWILDSGLGWLYTGLAFDSSRMLLYMDARKGWIWSSSDYWPIAYDYVSGGWVYFAGVPNIGIWLYEYKSNSWTSIAQ